MLLTRGNTAAPFPLWLSSLPISTKWELFINRKLSERVYHVIFHSDSQKRMRLLKSFKIQLLHSGASENPSFI